MKLGEYLVNLGKITPRDVERALKESGAKDVTFLKFEGAGHGVFGQHSNETHPAMARFFARVLEGPVDERGAPR